jgi:hypothetical protein
MDSGQRPMVVNASESTESGISRRMTPSMAPWTATRPTVDLRGISRVVEDGSGDWRSPEGEMGDRAYPN